jgi:hypothetical protein
MQKIGKASTYEIGKDAGSKKELTHAKEEDEVGP